MISGRIKGALHRGTPPTLLLVIRPGAAKGGQLRRFAASQETATVRHNRSPSSLSATNSSRCHVVRPRPRELRSIRCAKSDDWQVFGLRSRRGDPQCRRMACHATWRRDDLERPVGRAIADVAPLKSGAGRVAIGASAAHTGPYASSCASGRDPTIANPPVAPNCASGKGRYPVPHPTLRSSTSLLHDRCHYVVGTERVHHGLVASLVRG